jgi:hypothetical protein
VPLNVNIAAWQRKFQMFAYEFKQLFLLADKKFDDHSGVCVPLNHRRLVTLNIYSSPLVYFYRVEKNFFFFRISAI